MSAIIKYPGSKWRTAAWIISHFPPHHSYLEPFFGSGGVLFNKPRSNIETVNDLDSEVVNLFGWIQRDPERLARVLYWTPYAREVYDRAFLDMHTETDSFKRAGKFYIRMMFGRGFRTTGEKVGWKNDVQGREKAYAAICWAETPENVMAVAERLRGVQIEHCHAVEVIQRFNNPKVLIYADPPYVLGTRGNRKQYRHEMTDADHEELLAALKAHTGPVLLSGYDNPLYNAALQGWYREERPERTQTASPRTEVLWMNFEPPAQLGMEVTP